MLSLTRMRESAGLLGAVFTVIALVAGLSVALLGYLAQQSTEGVRTGLADRAGSDLGLRLSVVRGSDPIRQDEQIRAAILRSFDDTGAVMHVSRSIEQRVSLRVPGADDARVGASAIVATFQDFADRTELVDGAAATGDAEVLLQADAAELLELAPGDRVLLGGVEFTITGTWRATDYLDPRWYGEPIIATGFWRDHGPFVVDESAWSRFDDLPRARWVLVPDPTTVTSSNLAALATRWQGIDTAWRGTIDEMESLQKQGRFLQTARDLGIRVAGLAAIQPVTILLIAAIALVALAQLGSLLSATRSTETALIWSRGASAADIARATAVEIGLVAGAGAAVGLAAGAGVLVLVAGDLGLVAQYWPAIALLTGGAIVAAAGLAALSAFRSAGQQTVRDPSDASGRIRRLGAPGVVVLVAGAAALCIWQLQLYGSPLTPTNDGPVSVDPIAVMAPALGLIAVVLAVAVAFPVIAAAAERLARGGAVTAHLAARTVARRVSLAAAPLVVVALAAGSIVVAAGYSATWGDSFARSSGLRAGADLHVTSLLAGLSPDVLDALGAADGVDAVAPLEIQALAIGDVSSTIVAVAPDAIVTTAADGAGSFDRAAAADAIRTEVPALTLPAGADRVALSMTLTGFAAPPTVSLWVVDARGVLREIALDDEPVSAEVADGSADELRTWSGALDEVAVAGGEPTRVLAIDLQVPDAAVTGEDYASGRLASLTAEVAGASEEVELDEYFLPESPILQFAPPNADGSGLGFTLYSDTLDVRLTPVFDGSTADRVQPPVLISQEFAEVFSAEVGELVAFTLEDGVDRMNGKVVGVVPVIPGATEDAAMLIDLTVVQHYQLRVSEDPAIARDAWIRSADADTIAPALRPLLPANARIEAGGDPAGRQVLGAASLALWCGAAACVVLALIAVAAASRTQLRSRRDDIAVLRAIGMSPRDQGRVRAGEQLLILTTGLVAGLLAGTTVALLTVPQLARSAVPEPYDSIGTSLLIDLPALGAALGVLVAGLVVVIAAVAGAVRVLATRAIPEAAS